MASVFKEDIAQKLKSALSIETATKKLAPLLLGYINQPDNDALSRIWGSLGNFVFGQKNWIESTDFQESSIIVKYPNLAGYNELEQVLIDNRVCNISFRLWQNLEENPDPLEEFETNLYDTLNLLYKERNKAEPLELLQNSGTISLGFYFMERFTISVDEIGPAGPLEKVFLNVQLIKVPNAQVERWLNKKSSSKNLRKRNSVVNQIKERFTA